MKNTICFLLCLNVFLSFGLKNGPPFFERGNGPALELGLGSGVYFRPDYEPVIFGQSYTFNLDIQMKDRVYMGIQSQLGITKDNFYEPGRQLRDFGFSYLLGRSFLRNRNLKLSAGLGFGLMEYLIKYTRVVHGPILLPDEDVVDNKFEVAYSIPLRADLKLLQYRRFNISLVAGTFIDYVDKDIYLGRIYAMPVVKMKL